MNKFVCLNTLNDISPKSLKNKRVLLRADFNVPIGDDGVLDNNEDWRIRAVLPTIKYLLKHKVKIILLAHLGRPGGKVCENLRLGPIQNKLSQLLRRTVKKMPDCIGKEVEDAIKEMDTCEIFLLENLRFHAEEEENDDSFSKKLAKHGDVYINDAFADCHRKHSSIVGITKYLPSYAGLLLKKEFLEMTNAVNPKHPAVAIIGGAKIETKLPAVNRLAKIYDHVLVGGTIANQIINEPGRYVTSPNVVLPDKASVLREKGFDIGQISTSKFGKFIKKSKSIVWNGPMGKYEEKKYNKGTRGIISAIKSAHSRGARVLIGGGETINAIQRFAPKLASKKIKNFNISTGGGAMLEFLAGKDLPGIEVLIK